WRVWPVLAATVATYPAFWGLWQAFADAGLAPTARAWDATLAAMLSYVGFHIAVLTVCGLYLSARIWSGHSTPRQRATIDNINLLWIGSAAQGLFVAAWPLLVAWVMS